MRPSLHDVVDRLLDEGEPEQALALLRGFDERPDPLRRAESLALAFFRLRRYDRAAEVARDALRRGLDSPRLRDTNAQALHQLGLLHESRRQASRGTGGVEMLHLDAWTALYRSRLDQAEALALQILEGTPDHTASRGVLLGARALRGNTGAFKDLIGLWRSAGQPSTLETLIFVAERLGRSAEIDDIVVEAIHEPLASTQRFYWIVRHYLNRRQPLRALAILDDVPEMIKKRPALDLYRGMALIAAGRAEDALPPLRRAFAAQPSGVDEARFLLKALLRKRRWSQAFGVLGRHLNAKRRLLPPP